MNKNSNSKNITPRKIEIVGLITSVAFQNAKSCAKKLCKYHSKIFSAPKFRGMLEFDWDEHLTKQRRKFGGSYWSLLRPVAVLIDDQLVGSDVEFVEMANYRFSYRVETDNKYCKHAISKDYSRYLLHSKRCYVYLEIWIEKTRIGNLVFQLYSDLLPETCYNFRCLCTGEKGRTEEGVPLSYMNTEIFRICPMGWIQGGDIEHITGGGGRSVYGATFADESYCISHERRGVLSMANDGKHSNGSQFFVTLQPTLWMDYYYVAFGQLVEGVEVLKAIENVATHYEKPTRRIKIAKCGVVYAPRTEKERLERERLAAEAESQREYAATARRIAVMNACTVFTSSTASNLAQEFKFITPANVLDPRDVCSELNVQRFLDGKYYVMDVPIKTEDIIRPILNDLADGAIQEEDLKVYTSNELLARSIITDCIAKGIVSCEDYDLDKVSPSDIAMIQSYLYAIISNMSTTSSRLRKEDEEKLMDKTDEAIKDYIEEVITNIADSSSPALKTGSDTTASSSIVRVDVGPVLEELNEGVENLVTTDQEINMEGEGLHELGVPVVDGIMEMFKEAEDVELLHEKTGGFGTSSAPVVAFTNIEAAPENMPAVNEEVEENEEIAEASTEVAPENVGVVEDVENTAEDTAENTDENTAENTAENTTENSTEKTEETSNAE